MLFAVDYNDNRIHIDETHSNQEYYCPYCGAPLITKKGDYRQHHFAHKHGHVCSDTWTHSHSHGYDISPWHNAWQSLFPKENQEVKLCLGETQHRADVLVDRTVIEFQHSVMPVKAFDDRNNFYFNLGYKVIWLFNLSDLYDNGQLSFTTADNELIFSWKNPKKAFNNYDIQSGCIDLFFQLNDNDDSCIVQVKDVSAFGFETFTTKEFISKSKFLHYVGLQNGSCLPPCHDDLESNQKYLQFKKQYNINLNKQQERALQAVEGSTLLLAVPGSGKTTVLVSRLGHMIFNKNIPPEQILAITYNKSATSEMKERFSSLFGSDIGNRINFRTINSLALSIYRDYCQKKKKDEKHHIEDSEKEKLIKDIYNKYYEKDAYENNYHEFSTAITYIKNMMLEEEQILEYETDCPHLNDIFNAYQNKLQEAWKMDFDDQLVYAHMILRKDRNILSSLRNRYKYICVDEAQDTSKIQHEIIKLLAHGNNLFMVGDEDQSIYGFRGAYPKALLNFRYDYINPYILRMERNYRSTNQIVEKAQIFISQNKGRYEKNMISERGDGEKVQLIKVSSREEQYLHLLEVAKSAKTETAFLYRDNESVIVLVDLFLRNQVPFKLRKPEFNFFKTKIVQEIRAHLSLAINEYDAKLLEEVCNKGILFLKHQQRDWAIKNSLNHHKSIYDALEGQMTYLELRYRNRASEFRKVMSRVSKSNPADAISILLEEGYEKHIKDNHYNIGSVDILKTMAKQETTIDGFLRRLQELEQLWEKDFDSDAENPIILSTIHTSKGLEYDTVYMVDVYDGRFPSSKRNVFCRSKDGANNEQEERRLFYVGITRAKNKLNLFEIDDTPSSYIDELFPEHHSQHIEHSKQICFEKLHVYPSPQAKQCSLHSRQLKPQKKTAEEDYRIRYNEVKEKFVQQETPIRDSSDTRWVQCEVCHEIKEGKEFSSYGGTNRVNLGICSKCARKS